MGDKNFRIWSPTWRVIFLGTQLRFDSTFNFHFYRKFELYKLSQQKPFLALYWYIINVINIRMIVSLIFIFSPQYNRSCFAHFWARSKSSKYLQLKHGVMAVKRKTIHNLVMREIFVSREGELSHAGDRPKYLEPPAQVVRVNRYAICYRWNIFYIRTFHRTNVKRSRAQ